MNFLIKLREDELLSRVVQNSAHLLSSNSLSLALSVVQSILAARLLGAAGFGLLGIVMSYASTVNGLLSFRMSELVVRYGGKYLEQGEKQQAAALMKIAGIAEAAVSVLAFVVVAASAGLAARFIAKTPGAEWMFVVYGLGLLANFNAETATGVLQITNRIKARGTINALQSVISTLVIVAAAIISARGAGQGSAVLFAVLAAYLVGKMILGVGLVAVARAEAGRVLGRDWGSVPLSVLPSLREILGFAFSSNLSATAILVFRESELLWVGLFLNSEAAGLYKIAYTIVSFLSVPADPLILSVYPETNRLIVQQAWRRLRDVLRKVTLISLSYNLALALGLVLFGRLALSVFGGQYVAAYPAMMALLVGMTFNYTLFWNRPLLLSFGLQKFALGAILVAGILKILLAFPLVKRYGYTMEAALLSFYYVLSVGLIASRGLAELRRKEVGAAATAAV
jgi:O-antigen/teichoic acid export membrane protein